MDNNDSSTNVEQPIELVIDAARQHGEDSEPDHEVGDLQDALREMWGILTPGQKMAFLGMATVRDRYASALPAFPEDEADDAQEYFANKADEFGELLASESIERGDLYSQLMTAFPGFADDTDVDGADLVDWMGEHLEQLRSLSTEVLDLRASMEQAKTVAQRLYDELKEASDQLSHFTETDPLDECPYQGALRCGAAFLGLRQHSARS